MPQLRDIPNTDSLMQYWWRWKEVIAAVGFPSETECDSRSKRSNVGSEPRLEVDQVEVGAAGK